MNYIQYNIEDEPTKRKILKILDGEPPESYFMYNGIILISEGRYYMVDWDDKEGYSFTEHIPDFDFVYEEAHEEEEE